MIRLSITYLLLFVALVASSDVEQDEDAESETVKIQPSHPPQPKKMDESWPMTSVLKFQEFSSNEAQQTLFSDYIEGCYSYIGRDICDKNERDRLALNALQPSLMKNITETGYAKMKTPATTQQILDSYFRKFDKNLDYEEWGRQTHANHWEPELFTHDIELFMPLADRQTIQRQVQQVVERWCGVPLTFTTMNGIRGYRRGAVLAPRVEKLPMVISAILNVDQEDYKDSEEWPLEVIGRDGMAVNLTLQAGEMILYEGVSIIHGRPYPLQKW